MIRSLLRQCGAVEGVARLFEELGYPVKPRAVSAEALAELGLTAIPVVHLARFGGVDLYVVRTRSSRDRAALFEFEKALSGRNHVVRPVIVELSEENPESFSIHARARGARHRLDVDLDSPSQDVLDRICSLKVDRDGDPGMLLDRVLDREAVGRRFFEQFRKATRRVAALLHSGSAKESVTECSDQALLLLSRVLFVYMLQRKGWMDGDHRYLRARLSTCSRQGENFHRSILEPLFFDCLNTPRSIRTQAAQRLGRVPYLNGGLFEPSSFERRNASIALPNELWIEVLDSTFEPFSLSVSEHDDEGMHVDPEMLGRVFERLMESDERARTGSFYTPKVVVDRLATAAIVRWCSGGVRELATGLEGLLRGERTAICSETASHLLGRLTKISVLDPACGSGAFLLSALRTIETLTRSLMTIRGEQAPVDLRSKIAATSLYGVDLKMEAVRLCELRLWLAIVSTFDLDVDSVPPLPNLDRNILQGDSLLGPYDFLSNGENGLYRDWTRGLRDREILTSAYRHSSSPRRRRLADQLRKSDEVLARALLTRSLESDLDDLRVLEAGERGLFEGAPDLAKKRKAEIEARLESTRHNLQRLEKHETSFFSFELHFANVIASGGFAVVLGNPPWVRGSRVEKGRRKLLADRYRSFAPERRSGFRQAELAMAFVERSLALTAAGGVIAQLVPSKITSAEYARMVRGDLQKLVALNEVMDWSTDGKALFGADVFPLGIVATKGFDGDSVEYSSGTERFSIGRQQLSVDGPGSAWSLLPPPVRDVLGRIRHKYAPLVDVLGRGPVMGVKTGANGTFFLDDVEIRDGRPVVPDFGFDLPPGAIVRTVRGRDLQRWQATHSTWMLWPPALAGHKDLGRRIARRLGIGAASLRLAYVRSEHLGLKVAWKDVSRGLNAAVLPDRVCVQGVSFCLVPNQTLYSIDVATREEGLMLGGLLNSTVVNALALETAERAKDHHWRYMAGVVGSLPFPSLEPASSDYQSIVKEARRLELGEGDENRLNQLVARTYGLERGDLPILETFVRQRLGSAP